MPDREFTRESASLIVAAGKKYILHQPMEALGGEDPGESAIYKGMTEKEVISVLENNFSQLPLAVGMNNHMGSAVTESIDIMQIIMKYLYDNDKFFLDSFTTPKSVVIDVAKEYKVRNLQRNSMFLDNESNRDLIIEAIEAGKRLPKKRGML